MKEVEDVPQRDEELVDSYLQISQPTASEYKRASRPVLLEDTVHLAASLV